MPKIFCLNFESEKILDPNMKFLLFKNIETYGKWDILNDEIFNIFLSPIIPVPYQFIHFLITILRILPTSNIHICVITK